MKENSLKRRLKNGESVLGSWNIIPSPAITELAGYGGLDFIVIDLEHGPASFETIQSQICAAEASGIAPIVRVPSNIPHLILRSLDVGAYGIHVPHVSTREEAEAAVRYVKYHPRGERGLSPFTRAARYGRDEKGHAAQSNKDTMVVLNVEGKRGIDNLKEIVKVIDVDVIFIGPYDLSQSLEKPGMVNDPDVLRFIKQSAKIVNARGIAFGSFARDVRYMQMLLDYGARYITYMVDTTIMLDAYRSARESFVKLSSRRDKR